jgi:Tfp pilus assembly protein PilF
MARTWAIQSLLLVSSLVLSGCSEMFTYSQQSREQGLKYMELGQYPEAQGAFRDAVRQSPSDYRSYYYLGVLYDRDKQYANAITNFKTALQTQNIHIQGRDDIPFKLLIINGLAKTLAKSDNRDAEVGNLERQAASSATGDEYFVLAKVYAERGDADSAITAYAKAADQAPRKVYIVKDQGLYLEKVGQKAAAEQALRRAYRLNDTDQDVIAALRRLGVIPGPALKEETELVRPPLPRGPLPEVMPNGRPSQAPSPTAPGPRQPAPLPPPRPSESPAD